MMKKFKDIFLLFLTSQVFIIYGESVLVNIDRNIREIDQATSCAVGQWSGSQENACLCCLIKKIPQLDKGKTAIDIAAECVNEGACTQEFIDKLAKRSTSLESSLRNLYNTSVVIKKVDTKGVSFDRAGNFTEAGLATFLERAYAQGKLPISDFERVECLKVKDVFAQEKGLATSQLFLINSLCSVPSRSYILKEMAAKYSETRRLADFFALKEMDDLIWPKRVMGYPSLAIPLAFFQYGDHYLSLMPTADGVGLDKIVVQYFLNPTPENKKQAEKAYFDVGYAVAKFHQRFMKKEGALGLTVVHKDLHHKNIFYDKATGQVTLIDNENIPGTFKQPESVFVDVVYPILSPGISDLIVPKELLGKVPEWISLVTVPFLTGYVSAYPNDDWQAVFDQLITGIKGFRWTTLHLYGKFKPILDQKFQEVQQFVKNEIKPSFEGVLHKLEKSLLNMAELLNLFTQAPR